MEASASNAAGVIWRRDYFKPFGLSLVLAVFLVLFYGFQGFYPNIMYVFSNAFPPVIAGAALLAAVAALRRYRGNLRERFTLIWVSFTVGVGLWFLGEACWAFYTLFLGVEVPYPSFADAFWLAGYVPMFMGLFLYIKGFYRVLSKRALYFHALVFLALALLVFAVLMPVSLTGDEGLNVLFADFAYPLFDAVLLFLSLMGSAVFFKGRIGKSWLFLNAGLISYIIGDVLFSYTTAFGLYYCGHPLELFFHFGYLLLLLAFYTHMKEL